MAAWMLLLSPIALLAQNNLIGTVVSSSNNAGLANRAVIITRVLDSAGMRPTNEVATVLSDSIGHFGYVAQIAPGTMGFYKVQTRDCNNVLVGPVVAVFPNQVRQVRLAICTQRDTIAPPPPCAARAGFTGVRSGLTVAFTNTSTNAVRYEWSFGDGTSSTVASPSHTYLRPGVYNVRLTAVAANNCSNVVIVSTSVLPDSTNPNPCQVSANFNTSVSGLTASFSNMSRGAIAYRWTFGDGTSSDLASPNHTYAVSGSYRVLLVARTNNNCLDSAMQMVTVSAVRPPAQLTISGRITHMGASVPATVIAYGLGRDIRFVGRYVDSVGMYFITGLPAGRYIVRAMPRMAGPNMMPILSTYYGNTTRWSQATVIGLNDSTTNIQRNIEMQMPILDSSIAQGPVRRIRGRIIAGDSINAGGRPMDYSVAVNMDDATVTLLDAQGRALGSTTVASGGTWEMSLPLSQGQYQVMVEYPRVATTIAPITITTGTDTEVNFTATASGITSIKNAITTDASVRAFPNPAKDLVQITAANPIESITLTDVSGKSLVNSMLDANNQLYTLNTSQLTTGTYVLRIQTNKGISIQRLVLQ